MERDPSRNLLPHTQAPPQHMTPLPGFPVRPPWKEVPISRAVLCASRYSWQSSRKERCSISVALIPLSLRFPVSRALPQVPQWDPYKERHPSTEPYASHPLKIHLSLRVPDKGSPSMFPNWVPMERGTLSPEPLIYPCMSARVPQKRSPPTKWGKT